MNVPAVLVKLYPPAIRGRWGSDIADEARQAGPRSWFDTVIGAVKLWLHPSDWPEPAPGQTSRVLVTAFSAVVVAAGMLVRALGSGLTAGSGGLGLAWLAPFVIGLVLSAPLPPLTSSALVRLLAVGARTLALPSLAGAALVLVAHSDIAGHVSGIGHVVLVTCYWGTIAFAGVCLCRLVARIGRIAVAPSVRRLRFALLSGGTGLVLTAGRAAVVGSMPGSVALSCGLAALGALVLVVGRDLRRIRL